MLILEGGREPSGRETEESIVLKFLTLYLLTCYTLAFFVVFFLFPLLLLPFYVKRLVFSRNHKLILFLVIFGIILKSFWKYGFFFSPIDRCNK